MTRVLITGGAGFIGSSLAEACVRAGDDVAILDDLSLGKRTNLPHGTEFIEGSITDPNIVAVSMRGRDVVYHLAALPSVQRSIENPAETTRVNVGGTVAILDAARKADVSKVLFASSSSVYGDTPVSPKHEGLPYAPLSPYAASKAAGEIYLQSFSSAYGLPTVSLRFFNVYGPRQDPNGAYAAVIPRFVHFALAGQPLPIYGDGTISRDFTYVGDVVEALRRAARMPAANCKIMNVGQGASTTIKDIGSAIVRLAGSESRIEHCPPRVGDVGHSLADVSVLERILGYRPQTTIEAGLRATVDWHLSHDSAKKA